VALASGLAAGTLEICNLPNEDFGDNELLYLSWPPGWRKYLRKN
jgi:hypothetical protein